MSKPTLVAPVVGMPPRERPDRPDTNGELDGTEDAVALAFVRNNHGRFRYIPGAGWFDWTAHRWQRDVKMAHFNVARIICRERGEYAAGAAENKRLASAKMVAGVVALARTDPRIVQTIEAFDREPLELNTPAGICDLTTGAIRPHEHALVTKVTAVAPDFNASRELWHTFLRDIFGDDVDLVDFMRRLLGYFLTGSIREQILAFLYGTGANGKNTMLDLVQRIMGDYALKLPSEVLMARHGDRHPTEIAQLHGVRLAVANEIEEGEHWAESKIKELTGDALLTGRYMRQDFFTFPATHKHVIAGNHRPQVRAMDEAMKRRIVLVPFRVRFQGSRRDNHLPAKLWAAAPAILADLIEAAAEWHNHGLMIPEAVRAASEEYATTMDSLGNWIADCCVVNADADGKGGKLYTSYALWKRDRGEQPVSMTRWGEQMASRGHEKYRNNGARYRGIDLTGDALHRVESARS